MKKMMKKGMAVGMIGMAVAGTIGAGAYGMGKYMFKDNADLQTAISSGNYDDFAHALSEVDPRAADMMTEDRFAQILDGQEIRDQVDEAIEANDYEAWLEAVAEMPHGEDMAEIIQEEDFATLAEMHNARQDGDFETANELAEELGLEQGHRSGTMHGGFGGPGMMDDDVVAAIEAADYDAWLGAISDQPNAESMTELVSEEDFATYIEMHNARLAGDFETADALADELGLEQRRGMMQGMHGQHGGLGGPMMDDDVSAAIEANDYDAFVKALSETEMGQKFAGAMTEERFAEFVEHHQARENGGFEPGAGAIRGRMRRGLSS